MIRTFSFTVIDGYTESPVSATVTIDDSERGMTLEIDGHGYDLSDRNVRDLREILGQVEIPE
jgi:hypothetical protein